MTDIGINFLLFLRQFNTISLYVALINRERADWKFKMRFLIHEVVEYLTDHDKAISVELFVKHLIR